MSTNVWQLHVSKDTVYLICTEALQKPHRIGRPWRRPIPRSLSLSYLRLLPCQPKKTTTASTKKPLPPVHVHPSPCPQFTAAANPLRAVPLLVSSSLALSVLHQICFILPFVSSLGQSLTPSCLSSRSKPTLSHLFEP